MNHETNLMGAILSGNTDVFYQLEPEDFTDALFQRLMPVIGELLKSRVEINTITVHEKVPNEDFPTLMNIASISTPSLRFSAVNAVKKARAMREAKAFKPSSFPVEELPFQFVEHARKLRGMLNFQSESMVDIATELRRKVPRTPTGFKLLDSLLDGGIERGGVFTIGGIPGDGKTAIATHMAAKSLEQGKSVHFVTLEMTRPALVRRIMKSYWDKTQEEVDQNIDAALEMAGTLTVTDTLVRLPDVLASMSRHEDADLIIVDYIQRIRDNNYKDNRVSEIESVCGTIANFAREFEVPVIALSQLNRDYKSDRRDPPQMYHMKGSGAIEADSHIIGLLHNPNAKEEQEEFLVATPKKVEVQKDDERILFIRKNRNGRIGNIRLVFDKVKSRFVEDNFYDD